ncbi:MAG: hypothetical protein EPO10_13105 [Reyranella sp.]|nr:MAG: hypothetical protein EPO10_13105 [Reyranella sp.]
MAGWPIRFIASPIRRPKKSSKMSSATKIAVVCSAAKRPPIARALHALYGRLARLVLTSAGLKERYRVDKETIEVLARSAGLAKALAEFPEDVAISARQAADVARKIKRPADPTAEPWPPMKAGTTL